MGTIKLEIDLPEFEKELNISVTIRRDGEVTYSTSLPTTGNIVKDSSLMVNNSDPRFEKALVEESIKSKLGCRKLTKTTKLTDNPEPSSNKQHGGNCMDMDF